MTHISNFFLHTRDFFFTNNTFFYLPFCKIIINVFEDIIQKPLSHFHFGNFIQFKGKSHHDMGFFPIGLRLPEQGCLFEVVVEGARLGTNLGTLSKNRKDREVEARERRKERREERAKREKKRGKK